MDGEISLQPASWPRYDEVRPLRLSEEQLAFDPLNPRISREAERRFWEEEVEGGSFRLWEILHSSLGHVGYVCAFEFKEGACETGVGILKGAHWGRGYAREAYCLLLALLKREGLDSTYIITHRDNIRARRLYRRLGYEEEGHLLDEGVPMVRYGFRLEAL